MRAEVTTISPRGLWVGANGDELYIAFDEYPEFAHASVRELTRIELMSSTRLFWPCLGIELDMSSLRCFAA